MESRILFIDDEQEILEAYQGLFNCYKKDVLDELINELDLSQEEKTDSQEDIDYKIETASQGLEGVDKIRASLKEDNPFHIVFIDMRMPPGISGLETAKLIRELDQDIEIVFVTAYSDIDMKKIVSEVSPPDKILYLKKPFDIQEVKQFALNLTHKYHNSKIKERFLSNVTHELKTPLASILGFSSLVKDEEDLEEIHEYNNIIYKNANLMKSLIDDLLNVVRGGSTKLVKEQITLSSLLEHIYSMTAPTAMEKGLELNVEKKDDGLIFADKNKISQCLINLISNAIKFTDEGSVDVELFSEDKYVILKVSDTGIGIAPDYFDLIFQRFVRIEDEHHNVPGFGLGLAIVKEILEQHEATISIESKLGEGTTFIVRFNQLGE